MKRRTFLNYATLLTTSSILALNTHTWVAKSLAANNRKRLIVVFLRGAIDGLSVVVPYLEDNYYEARHNIAIAPPGEENGVIDLNGFFGLHPSLEPILPLWQNKSLAFIHACGSPDPTRSHFDAQYYMEVGKPGDKNLTEGWLNRLLGVLPKDQPTQAINFGESTPRILTGPMPVASVATGKNSATRLPIDRPQVNQYFDQMYASNDPISRTYQEGRMARELILTDLEKEMAMASGDARPTQGFVNDAKELAQLMLGDSRVQLGFIALGGWDTHVNQGAGKGQLANKLKPLGQGLATLARELGPLYKDTVIMVMSEFGRTVGENGNGGTDHGHGNVFWLYGGGIQGGQILGEWPGLDPANLYQKRDLAITTDFRGAIARVLQAHLQLNQSQISQVFPGFDSSASLPLF
jgi:uncharacterized protein (DUF1501 family)